MEKNRTTVILYTAGVCNLNCRYCGIDKNPILKDIDVALAKSFEGDYYFEQIKKYFPNRGQLKRIETWGGEPFLYMERIHPLIHKIINHYPYFDEFYSSTNFSYDTWNDKVFNLIKIFGQYPYRDFSFNLQLSCDGPEYINDAGRGIGTTKKCLANFKKFCELIENNVPSNVNLQINIKPTLDVTNLRILDTKQKIIEYYQFFEENFVHPIRELGFANVSIGCPVPNIAVPAPASKEDGIYFAKYCKACREIEQENYQNMYFKYYKTITMFTSGMDYDVLTYNYKCHTCGAGDVQVGFMPGGMMSTCHEGFTYFIEQYKQYAANSDRVETGTINFNKFIGEQNNIYCLDEKKYDEFEDKMSHYNKEGARARLANIALEIVLLAMAGQVDEKYMDFETALKAAICMQGRTAYCIKDNFNVTGTITMVDYGMLKLFLNGAIEYIQTNDNPLRV